MLFSTDQQESSLYKYFHEFLEELRNIKEAPEEGSRIQQQLMNVLKRQELDASQRGGEQHARLYKEAQYLMVAFADELFLHLFDWPGKATWNHELLEVKMFNTQIAGQKVFDSLETLLNKQDHRTMELARLYLIILALGFEGKYRNITQTAQRNQFTQYRLRLFFFITRRDTNNLSDHLHTDEKTRIFPDAYKYTLKSKHQEFSWQWWQRLLVYLNLREPDYDRRRWLPPRVIWWHWLLGAMVLGLVGSAILWEVQTAELQELLQTRCKILQTEKRLLAERIANDKRLLADMIAYDCYSEMVLSFNDKLALRFPFAKESSEEAFTNVATPEDIQRFFTDYDRYNNDLIKAFLAKTGLKSNLLRDLFQAAMAGLLNQAANDASAFIEQCAAQGGMVQND